METLEFTDISQHPVLKPAKLSKILTLIPKSGEAMVFTPLMPMVEERTDTVEFDVVTEFNGGMTPLVSPDSSSPIFGKYSRSTRKWEAAEFREKVQLTERDIRMFRRIGTREDIETAQRHLANRIKALKRRIERRVEYMLREVVFESTLALQTPDGVSVTVPYGHPQFLTPLASPLWSNAAADPLDNLQLWISDLNEASAYKVTKGRLPHDTLRILTRNTRFRSWADRNLSVFKGVQSNVQEALKMYMGNGIDLMEDSSKLNFDTLTTSLATGGASAVSLREQGQLEAGDNILIADRSKSAPTIERYVVDTITPTAGGGCDITIVGTFVRNIPAGAQVSYGKYNIKRDRMFLWAAPELPLDTADHGEVELVDTQMLQQPIQLVSTLSNYPDLMGQGVTGVWGHLHIPGDQDPPKIEYVVGMRALPRVNYTLAWMAPTIF